MSALTPAKVLLGVSSVVVPITISAIYARPTYSNLIKSKFEQEQIQAREQHDFVYDVYTPNQTQDKLLATYSVPTGSH